MNIFEKMKSAIFVEEEVSQPIQTNTQPQVTEKINLPKTCDEDMKKSMYIDLRNDTVASEKEISTFLDVVDSLKDVIPDEKTRFISAFKTISKTTSFTKTSILQSIDRCDKSISSQEATFKSSLQSEEVKTVAVEQSIKEQEREITRLEKTISDIKTNIETQRNKMNASNDNLNKIKNSFESSANQLRSEINEIKVKVNNYI